MEHYLRFREAVFLLKVGYPRVTHPFAAILLLLVCLPEGQQIHNSKIARLACLIHAASVHSEPGSNPPKAFITLNFQRTICSMVKHTTRETSLRNTFSLDFILNFFTFQITRLFPSRKSPISMYLLYTTAYFCQVFF